jgi:hypothetical protein
LKKVISTPADCSFIPWKKSRAYSEHLAHPTAPIGRTIETDIGSNIRENSDNNIDILGEEAKSNDCKLLKPSILD